MHELSYFTRSNELGVTFLFSFFCLKYKNYCSLNARHLFFMKRHNWKKPTKSTINKEIRCQNNFCRFGQWLSILYINKKYWTKRTYKNFILINASIHIWSHNKWIAHINKRKHNYKYYMSVYKNKMRNVYYNYQTNGIYKEFFHPNTLRLKKRLPRLQTPLFIFTGT